MLFSRIIFAWRYRGLIRIDNAIVTTKYLYLSLFFITIHKNIYIYNILDLF